MNASINKLVWLLLAAFLSLGSFTSVKAATWIAICNDGKNIQYNQTLNSSGLLYMKVKDGTGKYHTWQIAKLTQTFYNGTAICGTVTGNGTGNAATGSNPITQICANKSRKNIYVKYKHPYEVKPFESGVYCSATITIR